MVALATTKELPDLTVRQRKFDASGSSSTLFIPERASSSKGKTNYDSGRLKSQITSDGIASKARTFMAAEGGGSALDMAIREHSSLVGRPACGSIMKPTLKVSLVAGGYVVVILLESAVVGIRVANTSGPQAQASSGMYAFGDALLFVAVAGVSALMPTGAALFFLRPYRHFWTVLSALAVGVAVMGVTAAVLFSVGRHAPPSALATWAGLSVLRILIAPIFALTFLVCGPFSPSRLPRLAFLAATVMEVAVSAYGAAVWFVPLFFGGP